MTYTASATCEFRVTKDVADLKAQLDEFAKTNTHLAEWTFADDSEVK
ncbi:MAG: hypothetical protein ACKO0N_07655 [Planctomycetota bacterium]